MTKYFVILLSPKIPVHKIKKIRGCVSSCRRTGGRVCRSWVGRRRGLKAAEGLLVVLSCEGFDRMPRILRIIHERRSALSRLRAVDVVVSRRSSSTSNADNPVIDLGPLFAGETLCRFGVLGQIKKAMTSGGYFLASNLQHLDADYMAKIYKLSDHLHSLPIEQKKYFVKPFGTYSGADVGVHEDPYEVGTVSSACAFDFSRVVFSETGKKPVYPSAAGFPRVDVVLDDLYERQDRVSEALLVAFAEMFELPRCTFLQHFVGGDLGTIRLMQYPASASREESEFREKANVGISPHTDFEMFTLMSQAQHGLQILRQQEDSDRWYWSDAPVLPGVFIVIAGDMFERYTNGAVRALPHRVINTPHCRNSIIRFNALRPETLVSPLDMFVSPHRPARYTSVTMKEHMDTTMRNLKLGKGAWSPGNPGHSLTSVYEYH